VTHAGRLLALASVAVAFAAADTYVVVLALPDMMQGVGLPIDQLQQAAPIVSGFLLGYVALLPLIGRLTDLRGRVPLLVAGLVVFALGSLVTSLSYSLTVLVIGRFLQGLGGGALVPATLALVADLYPAERRGVPLGIVSGVQELGAVLGPLLGALILTVADWRVIFAVNLVVGVVLAIAIRRVGANTVPTRRICTPTRWPDALGALLALLTLLGGGLVFVEPQQVMRSVTWGTLYIPHLGDGRWGTDLGLATIVLAVAFVVRCWLAPRPLVDLRGWVASLRAVDLTGAVLLALVLAGIVLAFATADPEQAVLSARSGWYLLGSAIALVALLIHLRRAEDPLIPASALRRTPAWGAIVVSFLVGVALVAALVDVPLFARTTVDTGSQLDAALVLVRLLVAVPVGAVVGGYLVRRLPEGAVAAAGMALAAVGFVLMTRWDPDALHHAAATIPLVIAGLGFGLALAPVNSAVLAATDEALHGLTTSLVVVARMVGMLVGISVLTEVGMRAYFHATAGIPSLSQVCGGGGYCSAYGDLLQAAGVAQEHAVFAGAAVAAVVAAGVALATLLRSGHARLP